MKLPTKLEEELCGFIDFGGVMNKEERKLIITLLYSHFFYPNRKSSIGFNNTPIPKKYPNWFKIFNEIIDNQRLKRLTVNNEDFSISVVKEIVHWCQQTHYQMLVEEGLEQEANELEDFSKLILKDVKERGQLIEKLASLKDRYPELKHNWNFYQSRWEDLTSKRQEMEEEDGFEILERHTDLLIQNMLKDWKRVHYDKQERLEKIYLDKKFDQYIFSLQRKVEQLHHLGEMFLPYYNFLGVAWNESLGKWDSIPWDQLQSYAKHLQSDPGLVEIVQWLGRYSQNQALMVEKEMSSPLKNEAWIPKPHGKSEISGVHHSDHLEALIPSEVSLLSNQETEIIFAKKFVEKKLLTFQYRSEDIQAEEGDPEEKMYSSKGEEYGPIILCVDTSGSMFGKPERIAKALSFAILELALKQDRAAYVISFSTQIRTLKLNSITSNFTKLVDFLKLSFHGGTDLQPALTEALKILKEESYSYADVMVISDFALTQIETKLRNDIELRRKNYGTNFYSLHITRKEYSQHMASSIFDQHWIYDLDDKRIIWKSMVFLKELG